MDITLISEQLSASGFASIESLDDITVPVRNPVKCDIAYKAVRLANGPRIGVWVNGQPAASIVYTSGDGVAEQHVDISPLLRPGVNELRCRCIVSNDGLSTSSDEAAMSIRSEGSSVIRKVFKTPSTVEPFDQIWTLRLPLSE